MESPIIVWFRRDLRLYDNPALTQGAESIIIPLFIWDHGDPYNLGGASKWWLYKSLVALQKSLSSYRLKLILRRGDPLKILEEIIASHKVSALYWNRCYEPYAIARDKKIKDFFKPHLKCQSFNASLLAEPWTIKTQAGTPYQIFTPYWKALKALNNFPPPLPIPKNLKGCKEPILSDNLESWSLHPVHPDWSGGLEGEWMPGEEGAQKNLSFFLENLSQSYQKGRDFPGLNATSKLSPHLHWGEISPQQIWHSTLRSYSGDPDSNGWIFLSELAWREFCYHLLYYFPELPQKSLRKEFNQFPWKTDKSTLRKWQKGMTGYPIVDAGMRQLWHTGWMHNRVRMIAASFLIKDLLISWQEGASWFWDTLVDADLANNSANWQWVAGCGVDAAPYFRIFNPVRQGQKFDPQGEYVRQWVPELALLPNKYIHSPWEAPASLLKSAGVRLGETYPFPLVDHAKARLRALKAFEFTKTAVTK
ncbi:MAG: deoxyribodipyrimidine photolyase [Alphaproteobacteria bacterium 41-28]|nr:MAG: deoxyribodipyrimidine photolyase [Alphaproteobacteria bacterium 41-28]